MWQVSVVSTSVDRETIERVPGPNSLVPQNSLIDSTPYFT